MFTIIAQTRTYESFSFELVLQRIRRPRNVYIVTNISIIKLLFGTDISVLKITNSHNVWDSSCSVLSRGALSFFHPPPHTNSRPLHTHPPHSTLLSSAVNLTLLWEINFAHPKLHIQYHLKAASPKQLIWQQYKWNNSFVARNKPFDSVLNTVVYNNSCLCFQSFRDMWGNERTSVT